MKKIRPRNKIYLKNFNKILYINRKKIKKLNKKKWFFIKKKLRRKIIENIPENRKYFFKQRLDEKQKFKNFYGHLAEYKIKKKKSKVLKNFISTIESHLDINLVRFKKARNIFHAKQLINHKKVKVNNKIINKVNYLLSAGDVISIIK
jgi:small subunit ribosomal protein S4